ncbi:MAG: cellulose synthase, partial [Methylococcaceae bacterium]|nr:cellulose synthase [Methylococcaceae bacterium]
MQRITVSIITLTLIVTANIFFWAYMNKPDQVQSWEGLMMGVSFNPARRNDDPEKNLFPTKQEINQDLALLEGKVHAVRTYSVLNGYDQIAELAEKYNLNVTLG